jgi:hypothetical protein
MTDPAPSLLSLREYWRTKWPTALGLWSKFTRLSEPRWCFSDAEAEKEGLSESFAMIRLTDQAVVINLAQIEASHLERFALEILAHEIGHHILAPADMTDLARLIARMRWGLPTKEHLAPFVGNLYTDLLINDHLQRSAGLSVAAVYVALVREVSNPLMLLYMRIYEILWSLQTGTLTKGKLSDELEGDAHLGARLIRSYAREWLDGAGKFAALCLPYLLDDDGQDMQKLLKRWRDMQNAGAGGRDMPQGLAGMDAGEREGAIHPALDPELSGLPRQGQDGLPQDTGGQGGSPDQYRESFEYGEILRALGIDLSPLEAAVRYYRERAQPHLVRFPERVRPESSEPLPEGLEPWDIGEPLEDADWTESVMLSPRIIPGLTTVQRVWGTVEGAQPRPEPLDLDLYVDSSGSMPNPQNTVSYLTLAGAIIALSALRAGARVQATLWSGARQFQSTPGFVSNEQAILQVLTGYIGGSTAFPLHVLRATYEKRQAGDRPVHILIISDDGVTTMFDKDEQGHSGWDISHEALEKARGGGTMVLNLVSGWQTNKDLARANAEQGWQIHVVRNWEELLEFAKWFSQLKYAAGKTTDDGR